MTHDVPRSMYPLECRSPAQPQQHLGQQPDCPGLVERVIAVAALGRLHAGRTSRLALARVDPRGRLHADGPPPLPPARVAGVAGGAQPVAGPAVTAVGKARAAGMAVV